MSETGLAILQYYGAGTGLIAAFIVSLNISTRVSGWGFALFVTSSLALVAWGFLSEAGTGIGWQNVGLFIINCIGVYRYLLHGESKGDTQKGDA